MFNAFHWLRFIFHVERGLATSESRRRQQKTIDELQAAIPKVQKLISESEGFERRLHEENLAWIREQIGG